MKGHRLSAVAILMLSLLSPLHAQVGRPDTTATVRISQPDSVLLTPRQPFQPDSAASLPAKSPGTAVLLSAILPGAGQFYNQSYWKVPVVAGLGIYFVSEWLSNNRLYRDYRDQYAANLLVNPAGNNNLLSLREFYRDQRDSFTWYFLILYVVNLADAYVDASLFNFDVGGNLAENHVPSARLTLRIKF